jgi:hypothetical protein
MADSIVGGLFGVTPDMYRKATQERDYAQAMRAGSMASTPGSMMSPSLAPIYAEAAQQGQLIGRGVGALLGAQDPELQRITQIQQLSSQFDLTSPEGMRQFAQVLQPIAPNESMMAAKRADEMMSVREQTKLRTAQTEQAQAGRVVQVDLGDRIQLVNALTKEVISETKKGLTPQQAAKAASGGDGAGVAGPVGKSGAYRDADGIVYSATEMAKQRAGFQGLEKLADNLNSITEEDVKNAESFFDYTQGETLKTIGGKISPKTISAQAKINASQLLKQIESLPPGSASNADMIAAKSSFPGYGNADNLNKWIKDTKALLAASMQRQSEQYGFKQKVQVKGLDGTAPSETKNAPKTRKLKSGVVVTVQE